MVRIKHRYLLVNILYPEQHGHEGKATSITNLNGKVPDLINFHRPTPDGITPQLLIRAIKDHVSLMYGDYGIGMVTSSLNGVFIPLQSCTSISTVAGALQAWNGLMVR